MLGEGVAVGVPLEVNVIIRLQPPEGVPPLLIGMSIDEARNAMAVWGDPREERPAPGEVYRLRVYDAGLTRDVFAYFEDEEKVSAIEVWKPEDSKHGTVRVLFGDIDVFSLPADEVMRALRARGIHVDETDPYYPYCPELVLGFTREGGEDVVDEESGLARYFQSVVVAPPGYYD